MQSASNGVDLRAASPKRFARRLLTIGENRLELFMVELQEERERVMFAAFLALGTGVCALLAIIALTATFAVIFWAHSPVLVLLTVTGIYTAGAVYLYLRLTALLRNWEVFPATLAELRKDCACLDKHLT
jgi:uncharacterized membrane protein YqjE